MFRDLKEYQEIAKIYADKVSKPEDLEERVRGGGVSSNPVKPFEKPKPQVSGNRDKKPEVKGGITFKKPTPSSSNKRAEAAKKRREMQNKPSNTDASGKVIPSTAEIRAKAAAKRGGTPAIGGGNAGTSTDSGGTSKSTIKSVPVEKEKPEIKTNKFVEKNPPKEGSARAKMRAKNVEIFGKERVQKLVQKNQEFQAAKKSGNLAQFRKDNPKVSGADRAKQMAKDRIGSGTAKNPDKTIDQVRQSNEDSMRAKAKERHAAFKAKREARRLARMNKEEFTPYDIVLEYLLSSQQAATIEEANYIMTEMDAKTIQDIVS